MLLLTLLATLLPALLVLARFVHDRENAIQVDTATLAAFSQRRAEALSDKINGTAQLLYGLGRADLHTKDRAACSTFLSEVREAYPQYTGILTIKPDGALFCDSLRTGRELDLRDRGYFKAAVAQRANGVVAEPAFGRLTGVAVLQIAYPVRSESGELQYVLLASLNLQKLFDGDAPQLPGASLVVFDRKGSVYARSHGPDASQPEGSSLAGTALHQFALGHPQAASAELADPGTTHVSIWAVADDTSLRDTGLRLAAGAPKNALLATANQRFGEDIALLAGLAVLMFFVVWFFAEIVLRRQIMRSARMARQLAEGDLSARIEAPLPRGELGELMTRLNHAAESLQHQHDDISKLNARLMQSQRLEAVGQLTGGVAHDFNNLLTVVMGNAELLVEQTADQPEQRQLAEMIVGAAQRGASLTQQLLAFARKQALSPKPIDVNQLMAQMDSLLRRTLGEHIEIELIRAAGLWQAMVDQGLLGLGVDEQYGGSGGGITEVCAAMEAISSAGVPLALYLLTAFSRESILRHGTTEQCERFVTPTVTGESRMCFAITEPNAGTNSFAMETLATKTV
ncbi:MAG: acyl-CoA dehydrogenase family protein, partial [Rhizobacter sp.]